MIYRQNSISKYPFLNYPCPHFGCQKSRCSTWKSHFCSWCRRGYISGLVQSPASLVCEITASSNDNHTEIIDTSNHLKDEDFNGFHHLCRLKSHSVKMLDPHSCLMSISQGLLLLQLIHITLLRSNKKTQITKRKIQDPQSSPSFTPSKTIKNPQQTPQKSLCLHHQNPQLGAAPFASRGASRFAARRVKRWRSPSPGAPSTAEGPERGLRKYMVSVWIIICNDCSPPETAARKKHQLHSKHMLQATPNEDGLGLEQIHRECWWFHRIP